MRKRNAWLDLAHRALPAKCGASAGDTAVVAEGQTLCTALDQAGVGTAGGEVMAEVRQLLAGALSGRPAWRYSE